MSNGSQIGGAAGAVVGGIIGFAAGNPLMGIQYGYAIGSAIGGYIDPTRTQGPRLTDASVQTSTVGGVIPFGYGTFTTGGNIIWRDELKEHPKTERVGKGGSQENTTYRYTRSYAIGVCKGTISKYVWIKRNGKLVYAADPAALGAAMGWSADLIADLVASSNAFLQKATLYYGTYTQMPDPTQVAVEGAGNVSPNRGLAKIVLTDDDLTDTQGAVGQYEFCVFRGAAKSYTTPPYLVYYKDGLSSSSFAMDGVFKRVIAPYDYGEDTDVSSVALDGELRALIAEYDYGEDTDVSSVALDGELRVLIAEYDYLEPVDVSSVALNGTHRVIVLPYLNYAPEPVDVSSVALNGTHGPI